MKKFLTILFVVAMVTALFCGVTAFAAPVEVEVTADEGWESATYDPDTKVLTNTTDGYSFTVAGNASSAALEMAADPITSPTVVIPSSFVYDGTIWNIKRVGTNSDGSSNAHYRKGVHLGSGSDAKFGSGVGTGVTAVYNDKIEKIVISKGVTTVGYYAFKNSISLKELVLPDGLTTIRKGAFHNATALEALVVPATVTSFGEGAIGGCSSLKEITFLSEECPSITSKNNNIGTSTTIIYYPVNGTDYVGNELFNNRELVPVGEEPVVGGCSISAVTIAGADTTVTYSAVDADNNATVVVIIALYADGETEEMLAAKTVSMDGTSATFTGVTGAAKARIFMWSGLANAKPLYESAEY